MSQTEWVLLIVTLIVQVWAVRVMAMDHRLDGMTRVGFVLLIIILPFIGFFITYRLRQKLLDDRINDRKAIRQRLRGRIGR